MEKGSRWDMAEVLDTKEAITYAWLSERGLFL
jgi:hypothetical protein